MGRKMKNKNKTSKKIIENDCMWRHSHAFQTNKRYTRKTKTKSAIKKNTFRLFCHILNNLEYKTYHFYLLNHDYSKKLMRSITYVRNVMYVLLEKKIADIIYDTNK